jgi:ketosteroid isomerase-like protein
MIRLVLLLAFAVQSSAGNDFTAEREQWAHNLHDKRVEASIAQYAPDAEFHDPGGEVIHGTASLRRLFQNVTDTFDSDLTFLDHRSEISGNLAYDAGTYRETMVKRATGQKQEMHGTYLTVYRKNTDGRWLIIEQMWTAAPPDTNMPAQ